MNYSAEVLEELRSLNDIVDIVSYYVELKRKGNYYFGLCPFHNEKSSSFSVSADKQIYYCFGCQATGNVYSFIMSREGLSFPEAIRYLADKISYQLPSIEISKDYEAKMKIKEELYLLNVDIAKYFYEELNNPDNLYIKNYLKNRNIKEQIQKKFGLGFSPKYNDNLFNHLKNLGYSKEIILKSGVISINKNGGMYNRFYGRIIFPILNSSDKVVGFGGRILEDKDGVSKYLNSPQTDVFDKKFNLYGINFAKKTKLDNFILVEGYIDVITLNQNGFNNVIATLGTAFNNEHAKVIKKYVKNVIIFFDSDEAGVNATLRSIPILIQNGLRVKVAYTDLAKDPDEILDKLGKNEFEKIIMEAYSHIAFQIKIEKNNFDLEKSEELIDFTKKVCSFIIEVENEIEKEVYIKEIARLTSISENSIWSELNKIKKVSDVRTKIRPSNFSSKNNNYGFIKAQKELIYLVSANEKFYVSIKNLISPDELEDETYKKLLFIVYDFYEKNKPIYQAEIVNYFESQNEQEKILEVLNSSNELNDKEFSVIEQSIVQSLKIIKEYNIKKEMNLYLNDDKKIRELMKKLEYLRNENITLIHG